MSEYKIDNSKLGEVLCGSVVGVGKLADEFFRGVINLPLTFLTVPTAVRSIKSQFKEAGGRGENPLSVRSFKNYFSNTPVHAIGTLVGGVSIGQLADEAYRFVREHPYSLAVPVVTNLLSAGYERYKSDKEKRLEDKLK